MLSVQKKPPLANDNVGWRAKNGDAGQKMAHGDGIGQKPANNG